MIAINHPDLPAIAERHYLAIESYIETSAHKKVATINKEIQTQLGVDYDLRKIILANPETLRELADEKNKDFSCFPESYYSYLSLNDKFQVNGKPYKGSDIIDSLGIQVCPYCNRNFIYNLQGKRATYQLDHFYPQTDYPFLALSFYNLVPSCPTCNGLLQKKDKKVAVNPYCANFPFNKIRFRVEILAPDFYYTINSFEIKIDLSALSKEQKDDFVSNMTVFELEKHYEKHKPYILRLIQKNITFSEAYLKELKENFSHLFENESDMKGFVNENIDKNFHLRPLAKLTHDIAQELGLL